MTESKNLYTYTALLDTLLNYELEWMKTRIKCTGYEEDTTDGETNPATAGANTGLKALVANFNNSMMVRLIRRVHSDLWHEEKFIPSGLNLDGHLVLLFRHS